VIRGFIISEYKTSGRKAEEEKELNEENIYLREHESTNSGTAD